MSDTLRSIRTDTSSAAAEARKAQPARQVCPFCGQINEKAEPACPQCGMEDTPGTRQATRAKIGPWSVLQHRNPSAPGMNYETLLSLIAKGRVTPRSIVRGPTTHQLWRYAARVKGLSREFGLCWGCGGEISKTARLCPACKRLQEPPINPDILIEGQSEPIPSGNGDVDGNGRGKISPMASALADRLRADSPQRRPAMAAQTTLSIIDVPQASNNAMELAAFQIVSEHDRPRRKRHVGRWVFGLLLLAAAGATAVAYLNPPLWESVRDWTLQQWHEHVKPAVSGSSGQTGRPGDSTPGLVNFGPSGPTTAPSTRPGLSVEVGPKTPQPATQPIRRPDPAIEPGNVSIAPAASMTLEDMKRRAQALRKQAMDATADGDFAMAVKCWEEHAKLPDGVRHSDWQEELAAARRRLAEKR